MSITQNIDAALEKTIGQHGVADAALSGALARAEGALDRLRQHYIEGTLPLLRLPEKQDDLAGIRDAATRLRDGATDIVILGTGGSSLGGQTIAQLAGFNVPGVGVLRDLPRMHFIDNLDASSFETMLKRLPLKTSRFVAISKSGGTAETLMQTIAVMSALKATGADIAKAMLGISEPVKAGKRNGLRDLLTQAGVSLLEHDPNVGGRYSA
ncbi:MAG: glucose-6-phosphate isomerase, partial [Pseudolabrys sp.]